MASGYQDPTMRMLCNLALLIITGASVQNNPAPVLPSKGAAQSGLYRNMFAEAGYGEAEIEAKLQAAFQQLYFGDPKTERIYYEVPEEGTAYVTDAKNNDVRTEGMGYGMMIMVQMNNQTGFNMLWRWVKTHLYHGDPSDPYYGWSAWHASTNGTRLAEGPAPDGETWFITSLYFAAARWKTGANDLGGFDYRAEADTILSAVTSKSQNSQNMFTDEGIVRFDPGTTFTDPSYFLPAFYEVWASATNYTPPSHWHDAAVKTRDVLYASVNATTGLGPHSCSYTGGSPTGCNGYANCLNVESEDDAWRISRNWALDYAWWAADRRQVDMTASLFSFFSAHEPYAVFATNGTKLCGNTAPPCRGLSSGRVSMNAVAALASNSSIAWKFIKDLWEAPVPKGDDRDSDRYYSGSLYLEAFLHLSGNYRAWN